MMEFLGTETKHHINIFPQENKVPLALVHFSQPSFNGCPEGTEGYNRFNFFLQILHRAKLRQSHRNHFLFVERQDHLPLTSPNLLQTSP